MTRSKSSLFTIIAMAMVPFGSFAAEHSLSDINFTGPLITPGAGVMPQGLFNIEPYIVYTHTGGYYDNHGHRHSKHLGDERLLQLPMSYGLTKRLTADLTLSAAHLSSQQNHTSGMRMTDSTIGVQYLLRASNADHTRLPISVTLSQQLATGAYDHLRNNTKNGLGDGVKRTTVSIRTGQMIWMPNGRPLAWRAMLGWSPTPARVAVNGASVYQTKPGFHGHLKPGTAFTGAIGAEYSINSHWALAFDVLTTRTSKQHLTGTDKAGAPVDQNISAGFSYSVAPAIEYNFNQNFGVIAGIQTSIAGHNTSAYTSPQIAFNMVF